MSRIRASSRLLPLLLLSAAPLGAQAPDTAAAPAGPVAPLVVPGGEDDDRQRLAQLRGEAPLDGFLLRSPSTRTARPLHDDGRPGLVILAPTTTALWSSGIPFAPDAGPVWAGRGLTAHGLAGVRTEWGPLSLTLAPRFVYTQNRELGEAAARVMQDGRFIPPWRTGRYSADLPLRFGDEAFTSLEPGESTLSLDAGPVSVGGSTESQWWGPGVRNAIVMSDNAGGIPHAFVRTSRPLRTAWGTVEARWMLGWLEESGYFDAAESNDHRSLSALVATWRPAWRPGLTLGMARSVYAYASSAGAVSGHALDVLTRWSREDSTAAPDDGRPEQILSLFGRWVFPDDGLEVYGEWARHELPRSLRDFLVSPNHTQGYTLGLQWAGRVRGEDLFRVQSEVSYLEQSADFRSRPSDSFYASRSIPQGYTHRGRVIGAGIGPGGSSQWLAADYLAPAWRLGAFAGRIRWDNDAYYTRVSPWPFLGHDVSVFGGVRGSYHFPLLRVEAELGTGERLNFLFQNRATSWETSGIDAVDVRNHTFRLTVTPLPRPAPRTTAPPEVPPPPPILSVAPAPDSLLPGLRLPLPADTTLLPVDSASAPVSAPAPAPAPADTATAAPAPPAARTHVVAAGETFYGIARRYGVTVAALQAANPGVDPERLRAGQRLQVPEPSPTPPPAAQPRRHRVAPGETLYGIARRYGVRPEAIRAANRLPGDAIRAGQELLIP